MRRALVVAAVAVVALAARGEEAKGPGISFAETSATFSATVVGATLVHAFHYRNVGDQELVIRRVNPGCHCTVARVTRDRVKPGEEGTIELAVDTEAAALERGAGRTLTVRATVFTNDPTQREVGPGTTTLAISCELVTCFKLLPQGAFLNEVLRGREPVTADVRVTGLLDAASGFEITAVESPVDWIEVGVERAKEDRSHATLRVRVLPHVPRGAFVEHLTVRTSVARQPSFRLAVTGYSTGPVRGPEVVVFGRVRRGREPEQQGQLERIDGAERPTVVTAIDFDRARLDVQAAVVPRGAGGGVTVRLKRDAPPGPFASPVTIRLDDPESPEVSFVVFGEVLPRVAPDPASVVWPEGRKEARIAVPIDGGKLVSVSVEPPIVDATIDREARPVTVVLTSKRPLRAGETARVTLATDVAGEETAVVPLEVTPGR
jgi:hypothetical protein